MKMSLLRRAPFLGCERAKFAMCRLAPILPCFGMRNRFLGDKPDTGAPLNPELTDILPRNMELEYRRSTLDYMVEYGYDLGLSAPLLILLLAIPNVLLAVFTKVSVNRSLKRIIYSQSETKKYEFSYQDYSGNNQAEKEKLKEISLDHLYTFSKNAFWIGLRIYCIVKMYKIFFKIPENYLELRYNKERSENSATLDSLIHLISNADSLAASEYSIAVNVIYSLLATSLLYSSLGRRLKFSLYILFWGLVCFVSLKLPLGCVGILCVTNSVAITLNLLMKSTSTGGMLDLLFPIAMDEKDIQTNSEKKFVRDPNMLYFEKYTRLTKKKPN